MDVSDPFIPVGNGKFEESSERSDSSSSNESMNILDGLYSEKGDPSNLGALLCIK